MNLKLAMIVVKIEEGLLRGKIITEEEGLNFYSFQGVPYAEPPVGQLRFKAPQPIKPWKGIKDALNEGNESLSKHMFMKRIVGSEDCLNLNVYTPNIPGEYQNNTPCQKKKPVMFWIHGGIFSTGSNKTELFGPEFLMKEDVVLVTINYRLGVLGFLSLEDSNLGVPGNAAFKDMILALKWVQRNIVHFCGDPDNVTVFGESAGGSAAHLLMLSPMSKGLFHRVIAQSGSALNVWIYGQRSARLIAEEMGFNDSDERNILSFLQNSSAKNILRAQLVIDEIDNLETKIRFFGLVIEKPSKEEAFLTRSPIDIILSGDYNHVPLIMGYNHKEGIIFENLIPARKRDLFFHNRELFVPLPLNLERKSTISRMIADEIQTFYFGKKDITREKDLRKYYQLCSDATFLRDIFLSVKAHLITFSKPVYFYRLSLESELNFFKKLSGIDEPGVYHGDDLGYLFHTSFTPAIKSGSIEDVSQRRFTRMWANFARCANPTPNLKDDLLNVKWRPVEKEEFNFLDIDAKLAMRKNPEQEAMKFWSYLYKINPIYSKL